MKRKRALLWIVLVMLAIFVAGFIATWVSARDDKSACGRMAQPAGASTVRVLHKPDNSRVCVWLDGRGQTVKTRTLP
jgi:hypothetical protein